MRLLRACLAAALLLALAPTATDAAAPLPLGRYTGQTGDGHVFQFTVERSAKANRPRKITHFYLVYDIAGCRSGPIRQPYLTTVYYGATASKRGTFARTLGGERQLQLTGRFRSGGAGASGSFKVGIAGRCPITAATEALTFRVTRKG
jgi:hypothetical protein